MSWILEYFVVYLLCVYQVYTCMFGWLCRATYYSVVSTLMLGVSHAIQNTLMIGALWWTHNVSVF